MIACRACGARWDHNKWTAGCTTCGGAALERLCQSCDGQCGQVWSRAVTDSNERKQAIWNGGCGLPVEEQRAHMQARSPTADFSTFRFHQVTTPPRASRFPLPAPPMTRQSPTPLSPPAPTYTEPPPPERVRQLVDELVARSHGSEGLPARVAFHQVLVTRTRAVQVKWAGIRENLAFGDRETAEWAKGNARYAINVAATIAELDPTRFPTLGALRQAALIIVDHSSWDIDYDEPTSAREEFRATIEAD